MEGINIEISLPNIREQVIWIFFKRLTSLIPKTVGTFGKCKTCSKDIFLKEEKKNLLHEHLKLHPVKWNLYLNKLANAIKPDLPSSSVIDALKLATLIVDVDTDKEYFLKLPLSRLSRRMNSNLKLTESLNGFDGRIQNEYNISPVGQYMGSFDQNEALKLEIQLPESKLNFDGYTQFRHPDNISCKVYSIKDSYKEFDDLSKIDTLEIAEDENLYDDDETQLQYTCHNKECRIPCPCSPCCTGDSQCAEHRLRHEEMFDETLDTILIRSTEKYCKDKTFFKKSYIIKYPGIPITCKKCEQDFLHHISYHLDFHDNCKFCRKNRFKTYAETPGDFHCDVEKQAEFLKSVCPHCDSKFCEPHFRKKHIEYEHVQSPYSCDYCSTKFHSK